MKINAAIKQMIESEDFKNIAKQKNAQGAKYRMFKSGYNKGQAQIGSAISFLFDFGYQIEVQKPETK